MKAVKTLSAISAALLTAPVYAQEAAGSDLSSITSAFSAGSIVTAITTIFGTGMLIVLAWVGGRMALRAAKGAH